MSLAATKNSLADRHVFLPPREAADPAEAEGAPQPADRTPFYAQPRRSVGARSAHSASRRPGCSSGSSSDRRTTHPPTHCLRSATSTYRPSDSRSSTGARARSASTPPGPAAEPRLAPQALQLALDLPPRVAGRDVAPLVAQLLAARERELDLDAAVLEVEPRRDEREALLRDRSTRAARSPSGGAGACAAGRGRGSRGSPRCTRARGGRRATPRRRAPRRTPAAASPRRRAATSPRCR